MADEVKKYLNQDSLDAVKEVLGDYVKKETGKGLSSNDYTKEDKDKLAGVAAGADVSTIKGIKVNNTSLTPDSEKNVNIDLSDLANAEHTHSIDDIVDLQEALDAKLNKADITVLTKDEALDILRGTNA